MCGEHLAPVPAWSPVPVHPRVCGEHNFLAVPHQTSYGSSPRVRGTLPRPEETGPYYRFIPACAGNTSLRTRSRTPQTVHPRVCGEHYPAQRKQAPTTGSSPRVRGTLLHLDLAILNSRFIPACAGNTRIKEGGFRGTPVHPRVCGEHQTAAALKVKGTGSSPRVRGTHSSANPKKASWRFIPACAGNTNPNCTENPTITVHPRVCGEHHAIQISAPGWTGSSPRVRGTLFAGWPERPERRFIPACAGNTCVD